MFTFEETQNKSDLFPYLHDSTLKSLFLKPFL